MARDNQVDRQTQANVSYEVDMRPTTILEESMMGGYTRTNKPVGVADAKPAEWESTGGRGTGDAIDARTLGTNGRKW